MFFYISLPHAVKHTISSEPDSMLGSHSTVREKDLYTQFLFTARKQLR
jgi:hypothetical protein